MTVWLAWMCLENKFLIGVCQTRAKAERVCETHAGVLPEGWNSEQKELDAVLYRVEQKRVVKE